MKYTETTYTLPATKTYVTLELYEVYTTYLTTTTTFNTMLVLSSIQLFHLANIIYYHFL